MRTGVLDSLTKQVDHVKIETEETIFVFCRRKEEWL